MTGLWILVAGPYTSGAANEAERQALKGSRRS